MGIWALKKGLALSGNNQDNDKGVDFTSHGSANPWLGVGEIKNSGRSWSELEIWVLWMTDERNVCVGCACNLSATQTGPKRGYRERGKEKQHLKLHK